MMTYASIYNLSYNKKGHRGGKVKAEYGNYDCSDAVDFIFKRAYLDKLSEMALFEKKRYWLLNLLNFFNHLIILKNKLD